MKKIAILMALSFMPIVLYLWSMEPKPQAPLSAHQRRRQPHQSPPVPILVEETPRRSRSIDESSKDCPTTSLDKDKSIDDVLLEIEKQEKKISQHLEQMGYPQILNRDYLSVAEREEIFQLTSKKQQLAQRKLQALKEQIQKEVSL